MSVKSPEICSIFNSSPIRDMDLRMLLISHENRAGLNVEASLDSVMAAKRKITLE
jgi:hypothetical protein